MPSSKRRPLVILAVAAFILLVIISLVLSARSKNTGFDPDSGQYYDKNSGQTVSNPTGKGPDIYGSGSNKTIYLGEGSLIEAGLTDDRLPKLEYAFGNYFTQSKRSVKEVSIDVNSISHGLRKKFSSDPYSILFNVVFDRKETVKARVEYTGVSDFRLYLYNQKTGAQIYDSGVLNDQTKT